jgi:hypothetical protein
MDKQLLIMGAGAGTGALVPILMKKYVDPKYPGGVAGIKLSALIPIVTGAAGIGIGMFTHLIKNNELNNFIIMYGFAALVGGIATYATGLSLGGGGAMQLRTPAASGRYMNVRNPYYVTSKVPGYEGRGRGGTAGGVIYS